MTNSSSKQQQQQQQYHICCSNIQSSRSSSSRSSTMCTYILRSRYMYSAGRTIHVAHYYRYYSYYCSMFWTHDNRVSLFTCVFLMEFLLLLAISIKKSPLWSMSYSSSTLYTYTYQVPELLGSETTYIKTWPNKTNVKKKAHKKKWILVLETQVFRDLKCWPQMHKEETLSTEPWTT